MPSFISKMWDRISHSPTALYASFQIPSARNVDSIASEPPFKSDEAYFELRITEQFLRDRREYWNEYNPLTLVLSEFIYDKERRPFPFIVGPALLKGLEQLEGDERVRYRNTRVAGPAPYRGDDFTFFVGLFRVKTRDWARQALSLLESFAKVFDSSKLSSYLNITGPLMDGIESFFDMDDQMQFRLGQRNAFTDPGASADDNLQPGFFVSIRADENKIDKKKFWIKDGRLFFGENEQQLKPYIEQDYILYQIARLETRNDHTTFDFHKQWEEAQKQVWDGNEQKAREAYIYLNALLRRSPDLIPNHINRLATYYRSKFQEEFDAYKKSIDPTFPNIESSVNSLSKSFENLTSFDIPIEAISNYGKYFIEDVSTRSKIDGPVKLREEDIQAALAVQPSTDPSIKSVDIDKFIDALNSDIARNG